MSGKINNLFLLAGSPFHCSVSSRTSTSSSPHMVMRMDQWVTLLSTPRTAPLVSALASTAGPSPSRTLLRCTPPSSVLSPPSSWPDSGETTSTVLPRRSGTRLVVRDMSVDSPSSSSTPFTRSVSLPPLTFSFSLSISYHRVRSFVHFLHSSSPCPESGMSFYLLVPRISRVLFPRLLFINRDTRLFYRCSMPS
jgi:hypothetical protein